MNFEQQKRKLETDIKSLNVLMAVSIPVVVICLSVLAVSFINTNLAGARPLTGLIMFFACIPLILSVVLKGDYKNKYKQVCRMEEEAEKEAEAKAKVKAPVKRPKAVTRQKQEAAVAQDITEADPLQKIESKDEYLDDLSFVKDMKKTINGAWAQYDILIDARMYGWKTMIDWADYMVRNDLDNIDEITTGSMASTSNICDEFKEYGSIKDLPSLKNETGVLSVAGFSKTLGNIPMKIVWFNQTRTLRLFTVTGKEDLIRRYAETMIRRTFGKPEQMKPGRPHEIKDNQDKG